VRAEKFWVMKDLLRTHARVTPKQINTHEMTFNMRTTFFLFWAFFAFLPTNIEAQSDSLTIWRQQRDSLRSAGELNMAWDLAEKVIAVSEPDKKSNPTLYARDIDMWSRSMQDEGKMIETKPKLLEVKAFLESESFDTTKVYEDVLITLGYVYEELEQTDSFIILINAALSKLEQYRPTDHKSIASTKAMLASGLSAAGKIVEATRYFEEFIAYSKSHQLDRTITYAQQLTSYANVKYNIDDMLAAEKLLEEAIGIAKDLKKEYWIAYFENILASITYQLGDLHRADFLLQHALPILLEKSSADNEMYIYGKTTQASLLSTLALYREAIDLCDKMLVTMHDRTDYNYICFLRTKGEMLTKVNRAEEGLTCLKQSTLIARNYLHPSDPNRYFCIIWYAIALAESGYIELAKEIYEEAKNAAILAGIDPETEESCFEARLKILTHEHKYDDAISMLLKQLDNNKIKGHVRNRLLLQLADLYYLTDQPQVCLANLEKSRIENHASLLESLDFLTESQRFEYLKANQGFSSILFTAAAQNPTVFNPLIANYVVETKAMLMRQGSVLKQQIEAENNQELTATFNHWMQQRRQYGALQGDPAAALAMGYDLKNISRIVDSLERRIHQKTKVLDAWKAWSVPDWTQIAAQLQPNEAAVDISRFVLNAPDDKGKIGYAVLIIRPENGGSIQTVIIKNGDQLESFLAEWHRSTVRNNAKARILPQPIYDAFWAPIAPFLQGVTKIFWVPDGIYHNLAVEALPDPEQAGGILLDRHTFVRLFNIGDLMNPNLTFQKTGQAVLMGNPLFDLDKSTAPVILTGTAQRSLAGEMVATDSIRLIPLPGSQVEIEQLASLFQQNGQPSSIYFGEQATELQLESAHQPNILHIATHGYFQDVPQSRGGGGNPMVRSMLFFAGADNTLQQRTRASADDGIFTAYEAVQLQLEGTYLVTLSACHTGVASWLPGEGSFGMPRAFHMAGAGHTLVSLWEVEDEADQILLKSFYTNLFAGKDIHEALRLAKIEHRKNYPAPMYWAGWVLTGR
jgi:CHAT domain-containing protein